MQHHFLSTLHKLSSLSEVCRSDEEEEEEEEWRQHGQFLSNEETAERGEKETQIVPPTIEGRGAVVDYQMAVEPRQAEGAVEGAVRWHAILEEAGKGLQSTMWKDLKSYFVTMTQKMQPL